MEISIKFTENELRALSEALTLAIIHCKDSDSIKFNKLEREIQILMMINK